MKTIITNNSGLPQTEVMAEIARIMKKGFVVAGNRYQERTIYKECSIVCTKNDKSFTFTVGRI